MQHENPPGDSGPTSSAAPSEASAFATRHALPLDVHPLLDLQSDFTQLLVVPCGPAEAPYVEIAERGHPGFHVDVRGEAGTTFVRARGAWEGFEPWKGKWWDPAWWETKPWKRGGARIVAHVPAAVVGRIRTAAARIKIEGLRGCDLSVDADAGALSIDDVAGRLRLSTQAGRIDGVNLRGAIDAHTSAGAIRLEIAALDPGMHRIRTSMGAAHVELARGMPVRIDARTTMGATRIDYPSTRDAAVTLDVEADLGAIRVAASERTWTPAERVTSPSGANVPPTAYRTAARSEAAKADDAEVERVLERVKEGVISPAEARDLLRAMGWG